MVVTERPSTSLMAVMQARVVWPSTWTVQAPHSATPHPNLVPVSPNSSRKYHSSGIDGSPSKDFSWPLTRNLTKGASSPCRDAEDVATLFLGRRPGNIVNQKVTRMPTVAAIGAAGL